MSTSSSNYRRVPNISSNDSVGSLSSDVTQPPITIAAQQQQQFPPSPTGGVNNDNDDDPRGTGGGGATGRMILESRRSLSERYQDKLFALLWVMAALLVGYWASVPTVLFSLKSSSSATAHRPLLQIVALLLGINTVLILYLTIYLPNLSKQKIKADAAVWQVYCPRIIPTMTVLGVVSYILAIRATWPVWGFLAPAVLSIELLGGLFALQFVPWL